MDLMLNILHMVILLNIIRDKLSNSIAFIFILIILKLYVIQVY